MSVGHAVLDSRIRAAKAKEVTERILYVRKYFSLTASPMHSFLDIGTGSGDVPVAAEKLGKFTEISACDVVDQRDHANRRNSIKFFLSSIEGNFSFEENSADVINCQSVIEHVSEEFQADFLENSTKLLNRNGIYIISFPNKYALIEPHYKIPILGAMPSYLQKVLLKRFKGVENYDCFPLTNRGFRKMAKKIAIFNSRDIQFIDITFLAVAFKIGVNARNARFLKAVRFLPFLPSRIWMIYRPDER